MNTLFVQPDVNETDDLNKFFPLAEIVELVHNETQAHLKKGGFGLLLGQPAQKSRQK